MDAKVYEYLAAGRTKEAQAQVAQNMKSKRQQVLARGDWGAAWLLTGLPDPIAQSEWAGSVGEMATVSGYLKARATLKQKLAETRTLGQAISSSSSEDESPPQAAGKAQAKSEAKKKKKKKKKKPPQEDG